MIGIIMTAFLVAVVLYMIINMGVDLLGKIAEKIPRKEKTK